MDGRTNAKCSVRETVTELSMRGGITKEGKTERATRAAEEVKPGCTLQTLREEICWRKTEFGRKNDSEKIQAGTGVDAPRESPRDRSSELEVENKMK
jgi:hypothetical protein